MIKFEINIREKEYITLAYLTIITKPGLYKMLIIPFIICFFFFEKNIPIVDQSILFFLPIGYVIYKFTAALIFTHKLAKKNYKTFPALHERVSFEISSDEIKTNSESWNVQIRWGEFDTVQMRFNWIILNHPGGFALYIPVRSFKSKDNLTAFVAMAKENGLSVKGRMLVIKE